MPVDQPLGADAAIWPDMPPGTELRIVKLAPDGSEVTSYPGWVIDAGAPEPWLAVRADWVRRVVELNGLRFIPGDRLHEFFSPAHHFNVFSVWSPEGSLRGWYANVTHPARLDTATSPPTLYWHDLYVDVIGIQGRPCVIRDEDELEASNLAASDPGLHTRILQARDELLLRFERRAFPFHEG